MARPIERRRRPGVKRAFVVTPGQAIRQFCMECLCVASGRQAYDCLCVWPPACPLYPAHPFRGKPMPARIAPKVTGEAAEFIAAEQAELEAIAAQIPRRRPSAALIRRRCRDCYPEGGDCEMPTCALYPWNPRGKGMRPKRAMSAKQREAAAANLVAAQKACLSAQKPAQKASSAPVAPSESIGTGHAQDGPIPASFSGLLLRSTGDGR
jgi:hypothetical protein